MKSCLFLLLALSAAALVSARWAPSEDGVNGRSLTQLPSGSASAFCPAGCDRVNGGCIQDATMAGLRCQDCLGTLLVNKVNGNCSCPAGKYSTENFGCTDCPKGFFCEGGDFSTVGSPNRTQCPSNMTTVGKRSVSRRACVQLPGHYYTISTDGQTVGAVQCGVNTYSPGLKKQRACVPCPTGFTTNGVVGAVSPVQCLVPAGYYLKAPGQVAPCPMGEYKEGLGTAANCTKCAFGVTTPTEGAVHRNSCSILMPGYFAQSMDGPVVTQTVICPQGYYCPGGSTNSSYTPDPVGGNRRLLQDEVDPDKIIRCETGWTIEVGSSSAEQCLVPPGYFYNGTVTAKCPSGSYRADWKPASDATSSSCISCGVGVQASTTDQIKVYNDTGLGLVYWFEPVTTSADDCFIQPGQGLYYTSTTGTWRARNCDLNTYGVSKITYGLTPAPCRDCPANMVAINNSTYSNSALYWDNSTTAEYATFGFTDVKACVTQAGYGYNGRVAQQCEKGYWNTANNYNDCTACEYGLTTPAVGAGTKEGDCGMNEGFGFSSGAIRECPIGTYNNQTHQTSRTAPCINCPTGTTTQGTGSNKEEQCNLCEVGFGGIACNQTCGGDVGAAAAGTYGPAGRSPTDSENRECVACTTQQTGYSFSWQFTNDFYPVASISPVMANASTDCLAKYSQTFDGAWYMPDTNRSMITVTATNFADCVSKCDLWQVTATTVVPAVPNAANTFCQWITYDYKIVSDNCKIRYTTKQILVGAPVVGFKAAPSGDVATNAWSFNAETGETTPPKNAENTNAKALASGRYTMYQDEHGLEIGDWVAEDGVRVGQVAPAGADQFTDWQQCLNACDDDHACTGFIIRITTTVANRPKTCRLFYGRTDLGEFRRTFIRADISMLNDLSGRLI